MPVGNIWSNSLGANIDSYRSDAAPWWVTLSRSRTYVTFTWPIQKLRKYDVIHRTGSRLHHISQRRQRKTEPRRLKQYLSPWLAEILCSSVWCGIGSLYCYSLWNERLLADWLSRLFFRHCTFVFLCCATLGLKNSSIRHKGLLRVSY